MTDAVAPDAPAAPAAPDASAAAAPAAAATLLSGDAPAADAPAPTIDADASNPADEAKPAGAPEKYEFAAPEGSEFDPHTIAQFEEVARELNLDNASAQKVIDKLAPALAEKQAQAIERASAEWVSQVQADQEIGGDKLQASLVAARGALEQFGTPALRELLDASRLGNHPEVVKLLAKIGKAISPDSFVGGKPAPAEAKSTAQVLYPNQQK